MLSIKKDVIKAAILNSNHTKLAKDFNIPQKKQLEIFKKTKLQF